MRIIVTVSDTVSDEFGMIQDADKPCISVEFTTDTTTNGFTFDFKDTFPKKIRIRWYDSSRRIDFSGYEFYT